MIKSEYCNVELQFQHKHSNSTITFFFRYQSVGDALAALQGVEALDFMQPKIELIESHSGCQCVRAFHRVRRGIVATTMVAVNYPQNTLAEEIQEKLGVQTTITPCGDANHGCQQEVTFETITAIHEATPMMVVSVQRNIFNPVTHTYQKLADPIRLGGEVTIPLNAGGEAKYEVIASK